MVKFGNFWLTLDTLKRTFAASLESPQGRLGVVGPITPGRTCEAILEEHAWRCQPNLLENKNQKLNKE